MPRLAPNTRSPLLLGAWGGADKPISIGPAAYETRDPGGYFSLLSKETVRRTALAGVNASLPAALARPAGNGHDLFTHAAGPRCNPGIEAGRRTDTGIGGMADHQDRHLDRREPNVENGLGGPWPSHTLAA